MKDKQDSIWVVIISIALAAAAIVAWLNGWSLFPDPTQDDLSDQYELVKIDTKCIVITDNVQIRSEPKIIQDPNGSNSFGQAKKTGFSIRVSSVYETKETLDKINGDFIGLKVDEVLLTAEGNEWLPRGIVNDPDGIVWINSRYIMIIS